MLNFGFFLQSGTCKESDDPIPPALAVPTLTRFSPTSGTMGAVAILTGTNFSTSLLEAIISAATAASFLSH